MKILYISNYMNHHQLALCDELSKLCDNFVFLATGQVSDSRLALGYDDMNRSREYILRDYDGSSSVETINGLVTSSDVVMLGNCKNDYVDTRFKLAPEKLTIFVTERLLKRGLWTRFIPIIRHKWRRRIIIHKNQNAKILCASAYTPYDLSLLGFPVKNRCMKWGYFPEIKKIDINKLLKLKMMNQIPEIIFCGRLIGWKKLDVAIRVLSRIKNDGLRFHMTVVGEGKNRLRYERLANKLQLDNDISFVGSVPHNEVQCYMGKANIAIFTSSFREGWGAVLNEFMSNSCAIVASHAPGSVPYMLKNGINAFIYKYGDRRGMYSILKKLITDPKLSAKIGTEAYSDYYVYWTPQVAAGRLMGILSENKRPKDYQVGPCSEATVIKNKDI